MKSTIKTIDWSTIYTNSEAHFVIIQQLSKQPINQLLPKSGIW